jgi:hypothetical protein
MPGSVARYAEPKAGGTEVGDAPVIPDAVWNRALDLIKIDLEGLRAVQLELTGEGARTRAAYSSLATTYLGLAATPERRM